MQDSKEELQPTQCHDVIPVAQRMFVARWWSAKIAVPAKCLPLETKACTGCLYRSKGSWLPLLYSSKHPVLRWFWKPRWIWSSGEIEEADGRYIVVGARSKLERAAVLGSNISYSAAVGFAVMAVVRCILGQVEGSVRETMNTVAFVALAHMIPSALLFLLSLFLLPSGKVSGASVDPDDEFSRHRIAVLTARVGRGWPRVYESVVRWARYGFEWLGCTVIATGLAITVLSPGPINGLFFLGFFGVVFLLVQGGVNSWVARRLEKEQSIRLRDMAYDLLVRFGPFAS